VLGPARDAGVTVVAAGVFATGLLATARPAPGATFEYRPPDPGVLDRTRRIASICAGHGVEVPAAALAFPLLHPAVAGVVVGMRSPREVDENARHFDTVVPSELWGHLAAEGLI
jgi:D-threo-aldose 1-dehydrogenase